jgi:hypothetical protein
MRYRDLYWLLFGYFIGGGLRGRWRCVYHQTDSGAMRQRHAKMEMEPSGPMAGARSAAGRQSARPSSDAKLSSMNWGLRLEPKRCRKLTVPIDADSGAVGQALSQGGLKGPEEDVQHGTGGPGPVVEVGSQTLGEGEHKLSHRYVWEDMVHHMGGGLGHVAGPA